MSDSGEIPRDQRQRSREQLADFILSADSVAREGQRRNAGDFENGSEMPREMGINERAINRVNGRRHAILPRRRFQGDGLLTGAD